MSNMEQPSRQPRLVDVMKPAHRRVAYAVLGVITPVVTTAAVVLADGFQAADLIPMGMSAVAGAGFGMAGANTPR